MLCCSFAKFSFYGRIKPYPAPARSLLTIRFVATRSIVTQVKQAAAVDAFFFSIDFKIGLLRRVSFIFEYLFSKGCIGAF